MALVIAVIAAVTTGVAATTSVFINNRSVDVRNRASKPVVVTVDGQEVTMKPGVKLKFNVKNATPIRIKVKWPNSEKSDLGCQLEKLEDDLHGNYYITERRDGGLRINLNKGLWMAIKSII